MNGNKRKSILTLKIFALIVLNDLVDTVAQLFMKKGVLATGISVVTPATIAEFVARGVSSWPLWAGVVIFILNFFVWIAILYKVDLSIAMPVGSTSYIFIPLAAMLFLHERVSLFRWIGIGAIVLGIHFVSQSSRREEGGRVRA